MGDAELTADKAWGRACQGPQTPRSPGDQAGHPVWGMSPECPWQWLLHLPKIFNWKKFKEKSSWTIWCSKFFLAPNRTAVRGGILLWPYSSGAKKVLIQPETRFNDSICFSLPCRKGAKGHGENSLTAKQCMSRSDCSTPNHSKRKSQPTSDHVLPGW